jgi:hypothetical protein
MSELVSLFRDIAANAKVKKVTPRPEFPEYCLLEDQFTYAHFDDKGAIQTRRRASSLDAPVRVSHRRGHMFELPLTFGGGQPYPIIHSGLLPISGGTSVGKSEFIGYMGRLMKLKRFIAVEPPDSEDEHELDETIYSSVDAGLMACIEHQRADPSVLVVLDSLREALFEIDGPAGEKGIINAFFTSLTRVSNTLATNGHTILAPVNPMMDDREYVKGFHNRLASAVPNYIILTARVESGPNVIFEGVLARRPDRKERSFTMKVEKDATSERGSNQVKSVPFDYFIPPRDEGDQLLARAGARVSMPM